MISCETRYKSRSRVGTFQFGVNFDPELIMRFLGAILVVMAVVFALVVSYHQFNLKYTKDVANTENGIKINSVMSCTVKAQSTPIAFRMQHTTQHRHA